MSHSKTSIEYSVFVTVYRLSKTTRGIEATEASIKQAKVAPSTLTIHSYFVSLSVCRFEWVKVGYNIQGMGE